MGAGRFGPHQEHAAVEEQAAAAAGRNPGEIRLIAVSKYMPVEYVQQAMQAGQYIFGENTLQDATGKLAAITDPGIEWHFIGHLQSNKAKYAVRLFDLIHSVDSIKLARELVKKPTGRTLYVLDEPSIGLHSRDIRRLIAVLHRLRDHGNTVVVIEHNLDVIKTADWIIDLGPEGGDGGGRIIASGTPEDVAATGGSFTGEFLQPLLGTPATRKTAS